MTEINPVVRTEIEYARARARKMEERCRAAWQAAVPTLPGAARLARETKSWADRAASWAAVLELLDAPAVTRPLSNGRISEWATNAADKYRKPHHFADNRNAYSITCGLCGHTEAYSSDPGHAMARHWDADHSDQPPLPVVYRDPESEPELDAGMTPGELLRTPKASWYCDRPGCGHGDNVHGPFCFAAGCVCPDFRRTERAARR